jgi:hypothetical protein
MIERLFVDETTVVTLFLAGDNLDVKCDVCECETQVTKVYNEEPFFEIVIESQNEIIGMFVEFIISDPFTHRNSFIRKSILTDFLNEIEQDFELDFLFSKTEDEYVLVEDINVIKLLYSDGRIVTLGE